MTLGGLLHLIYLKGNKMSNVQVGWSPYSRNGSAKELDAWKDITFFAPDPAVQSIAKTTSSLYTRCPAWIDYFKNVYVIRCPVDFVLKLDKTNQSVWIDRHGRDFIEDNMLPRWQDSGPNGKLLVSIAFSYFFCADTDVDLEIMPAWAHYSDLLKNIKTIPGRFNINKWPRPIDFGFEIDDDAIELVFKRGDPLFYVKFVPANNQKVSLVRISLDDQEHGIISAINAFKRYVKNMSLDDCYQAGKGLITGKKWLPKKCPFGFK